MCDSDVLVKVLLLCCVINNVLAQPFKCNQQPPDTDTPPSEESNPYVLTVSAKNNKFSLDQTYVLVLSTTVKDRMFKGFMITVEDPDVDFNRHRNVDVGRLKTLDDDQMTKYSARCYSSVENKDTSDKQGIELHWVSPKNAISGLQVRFRAMVAENSERWYTGENLTLTLTKDDEPPVDSPPQKPRAECNLCTEARYEVIFTGQWSQASHSLHYPNKPDENGYSPMIGASHTYDYTLWQPGMSASTGLKDLAERANITKLERDIIDAAETRTLIRGKMHRHPFMSEPSHALFRVDKKHHLFSLLVAMKPSPDWFLGTSKFELCQENGWRDHYRMPLYPWDAGTMDGVSYDSETSVTNPQQQVHRVAVGSFDKASPFYQKNLADLQPFAILEVKKLNEYPVLGCGEEETDENGKSDSNSEQEEGEEGNEEEEEPQLSESRLNMECPEPGPWSACEPDTGLCGLGFQTRTRYGRSASATHPYNQETKPFADCFQETEGQPCFVDC